MKVAILVGGLPPIYNGGTEIATTKIADWATRAGHDVHVIAADMFNKGKGLYEAQEKGFKVYRVRTLPFYYGREFSFIGKALSIIMSLKPDLVHAQAIYMCPAAYLASFVGIPYLLYERGSISMDFRYKALYYKMLMSRATRIVAQTEFQRSALQKHTKKMIEVIPNGVGSDRFGKWGKLEARIILGLPLDKQIVLSVGRCRPEKNIGQFVDVALSDVERYYVSVGDGVEMEALKKRANGRVRFVGLVNNDVVPIYMSAADILVNTSLLEGFPVAFLEGMASGLPIVAPRIDGIHEIVEEGVNGFLSEPRDSSSTLDCINRILNNRSLANSMSWNNKKKAQAYTWRNVVKALYGEK